MYEAIQCTLYTNTPLLFILFTYECGLFTQYKKKSVRADVKLFRTNKIYIVHVHI